MSVVLAQAGLLRWCSGFVAAMLGYNAGDRSYGAQVYPICMNLNMQHILIEGMHGMTGFQT